MYLQQFGSFKFTINQCRSLLNHLSVLSNGSSCRYSVSNRLNQLASKPNWVPFYKAKYGNHVLDAPILDNQYVGNAFLKNYLKCHIPPEVSIFIY